MAAVIQLCWLGGRRGGEPSCRELGPASTTLAAPIRRATPPHGPCRRRLTARQARRQAGGAPAAAAPDASRDAPSHSGSADRGAAHLNGSASSSSSSSSSSNGSNGSRPYSPAVQLGEEDVSNPSIRTKFVAETLLPTKQGKFRLRGYRHTTDGGRTFTEPSVIIAGRPEGCADVPVRVHDACFTSEVLGSLKCDCREQLQLALDYIQHNQARPGMVIYLQQEGRGIGLANKIAAYALQEKGLDTVDANRALGLPDDCREYSAVRFILAELGIKSIKLMTNNPRKMNELSQRGIAITGRIPCLVQAQAYNASYLSAKERRMAHLLSDVSDSDASEAELSGDEASFEESAAGIVGDAEAVVSEGVVGLVKRPVPPSGRGQPRVPPTAAETAAQQQWDAGQEEGPECVDEAELDGSFCWYDHSGEPSSAGIPMEPEVPLPEGLSSITGPPLGGASGGSGGGARGATPRHAAAKPGGCGSSSSLDDA
eukprot:scaffold14.g1171.t1